MTSQDEERLTTAELAMKGPEGMTPREAKKFLRGINTKGIKEFNQLNKKHK